MTIMVEIRRDHHIFIVVRVCFDFSVCGQLTGNHFGKLLPSCAESDKVGSLAKGYDFRNVRNR
jgi:hypothetical protein